MVVSRAYDRLAPIYDGLASAWSGDRVATCHRRVAERLEPGEHVLFAGVGSGRDAAAAARRGVRTTLLDVSPVMLSRAARRVRRGGAAPQTIESDIRTCALDVAYDAVVASFFLNVFDAETLPVIVERLAAMTSRGGRILTADFAPPAGRTAARCFQRLYHDIPMHCFARLAGNARHQIHDLAGALADAGIRITARLPIRVFGLGPAWLEVLEGTVR